jgi:hypothetical protein
MVGSNSIPPYNLIRRDGSSKPAYDELLKCMKGEWWLSPQETATCADGRVRFSGFPGVYEVALDGLRNIVSLERGMEKVEVKM